MRRTTSLTALLLGATLLTPTGIATAVGETCRGEAATIVGTGPDIQGTDGRDVIVTGSATTVNSYAGNDLICVTGPRTRNSVNIDSGAGDDTVDGTADRVGDSFTILGEGADTFVGSDAQDVVFTGPLTGPRGVPAAEAERDVIDTGAGDDIVASGGPEVANDDDIRTGGGNDEVAWSGVPGSDGVLDAGTGNLDLLRIGTSGQTFRLDLAAGTMSQDGTEIASLNSFETVQVLRRDRDAATVEIVGSQDDEDVEVYAASVVHADLLGGDDTLRLSGTKSRSRVDLGEGTDEVSASSSGGSVEADLTVGTLTVDGSAVSTLAGVEDASISARQAVVVGNGERNVLHTAGCITNIDGRGGDDDIDLSNYDFDSDTSFDCERSRIIVRGGSGADELSGQRRAERFYGGAGDDTIRTGPAIQGRNKAWGGPGNDVLDGGSGKDLLTGGAGDDRLEGSGGADVLRGGAGRDRGLGGPGRDRCTTEVEKSCER